jgi:hypothetical protein
MLIIYVRTQVTADQVIITAPGAQNTATLAIAHTESTGTILVGPAGDTATPNSDDQNTAQAQEQGSSQSTQGVGGAIAGVLNPSASSGSGGSGSGSGSGSGESAGGSGSGSSGSQSGGSAPLPSPLVVALGGKQTTVAPTVIANPTGTGSVTAFVLGPGSTLVAGGSAIVVSGSTISAPSATTTTGGVGDAIASGLGYTGPLSTGLASSLRGPNLPMWVLAAMAGVLGALAVGL